MADELLVFLSGQHVGAVGQTPGGRHQLAYEVVEKNWTRHAREVGMDPDERLRRASQLASAVVDAFRDELAELGTPGRELADRLLPRMSRHAGEIAERTGRASTLWLP